MEGGKTRSLCAATAEFIETAQLRENVKTDVDVVAGLGGITTAYLLAVAGLK